MTLLRNLLWCVLLLLLRLLGLLSLLQLCLLDGTLASSVTNAALLAELAATNTVVLMAEAAAVGELALALEKKAAQRLLLPLALSLEAATDERLLAAGAHAERSATAITTSKTSHASWGIPLLLEPATERAAESSTASTHDHPTSAWLLEATGIGSLERCWACAVRTVELLLRREGWVGGWLLIGSWLLVCTVSGVATSVLKVDDLSHCAFLFWVCFFFLRVCPLPFFSFDLLFKRTLQEKRVAQPDHDRVQGRLRKLGEELPSKVRMLSK